MRQLRRLSARTGSCVLVVNHEKVRFTAEGDAEEEEEEGGGGGEDLHRPSLGKLFSGAADVRCEGKLTGTLTTLVKTLSCVFCCAWPGCA